MVQRVPTCGKELAVRRKVGQTLSPESCEDLADCPDVEFVQLARPTLSLVKYLQQVGTGTEEIW